MESYGVSFNSATGKMEEVLGYSIRGANPNIEGDWIELAQVLMGREAQTKSECYAKAKRYLEVRKEMEPHRKYQMVLMKVVGEV